MKPLKESDLKIVTKIHNIAYIHSLKSKKL